MARDPITAPPAAQPRYSLLVAANANGTTTGERWENGVVWTPEACAAGDLAPAWCGVNPERQPPAQPGRAIADPFYVWSADQCSAQGFAARDWEGRARRALEATQSFQVARELWTGQHTLAELAASRTDQASPFLADTSMVVDSNLPAARAIAVLEQLAMACSQGRRLMIHVPIVVLAEAQEDGYVLRDTGGVLTTAMGSIVVADAGYPGTGPTGPEGDRTPDNSTMWIYATSIVQVRLGEVEPLPKTLADAYGASQALNRPTNHIVVWAQRLALYQLDPCCRIALSTDLPALPPITTVQS